MTIEEARDILNDIKFEDYKFDIFERNGEMYLQASYYEADNDTSAIEIQKTRKWKISRHAIKSEVVQTAFKCAITSSEHRTREHFTYKDERVFGPHFDIDALVQLARDNRLAFQNPIEGKTNKC